MGELLAAHLPPRADPRLRRVTVEQLLTMTSGLASDARPGGRDERRWHRMLASRDWVRHILGRRLVSQPGAEYAYSSAGTGQSLLAYARTRPVTAALHGQLHGDRLRSWEAAGRHRG